MRIIMRIPPQGRRTTGLGEARFRRLSSILPTETRDRAPLPPHEDPPPGRVLVRYLGVCEGTRTPGLRSHSPTL